MKVIILSAGMGTRLGALTKSKPKCMVSLGGKTILEHQTEVLSSVGITDINIIAGHKSEVFKNSNHKIFLNSDFKFSNMVESLFKAKSLFDGSNDIIISYGDIVYKREIIQKLLNENCEFAITADVNWREYWEARMTDPLVDAETFKFNTSDFQITEIGKKAKNFDEIQAQYMGLLKIRKEIAPDFLDSWNSLPDKLATVGKEKKTIYMTEFLQYLIEQGWKMKAVLIRNGWLEIDTPDDLSLFGSKFF